MTRINRHLLAMATFQLSIFVTFSLFCLTLCNTTPPQLATLIPGCTYNGNVYKPGESFQPSPCEHCYCTPGGLPACAIADCFITPCVDAVHDPTKCCPVCPNGENCRHSDGTIIKKGEVYKPDKYTTCECPVNSWGMQGNMALCAMQAQTLAPIQQVS